MKRLTCEIEIGTSPKYVFKNVTEITIKSSYQNLTDTAEITIPRKLSFNRKPIASDGGVFKRGDKITVRAGYDFEFKTIFSGYLVSIKPGTPIVLQCEDEMFNLKKGAISKAHKSNVTLLDLLSEIVPGYPVKSVEADLGKFRIVKATPAQVLEGLRKEYVIKSFFRDGTLYAGLAYWPELQQSPAPRFVFSSNIIEHDLTYQSKEDVKLKVTAVSINPDNSKLEVEVGDQSGESRTLTYYNKTAKQLKELAEKELDNFRFTGFRGSFTTFGEPFVNHGDKIELVDANVPDRNGFYIVEEVERSFGFSGYRQRIKLAMKV